MTERPSNPNSSDRMSEAARLDRICDQFESAWKDGKRPRIEDCLAEMPEPSRPGLLRELLALELEYRDQAGEQPTAEEYPVRFPKHSEIVDELTGDGVTTSQAGSQTDPVRRGARAGRRRRPSPVRLNCPHCHNPIEIVEDEQANDALCPSCGCSFQLDPGRTYSWPQEKLPRLGKFELLEAVGRGAFGTVYRAFDTQLGRVVAVKVPRSGRLATKGDEDRFVREARSVAQLRHPAIVSVYEVGRSDTFPYIATEFVEGVDLAEALSGRGFRFREAAELMAKVAGALGHGHSKRVIHRDLKPSNIMLERDTGLATGADEFPSGGLATSGGSTNVSKGSRAAMRFRTEFVPRIMDFGLAKRDAGEVTMTLDGQVLGTPAYMSPEQIRGPHSVDGRSDLYSLGVILYQLTTGELPFHGVMRTLLNQVLYDEPRSPRQLNDRIPSDLETITLKCMAKDRDRRYATAADVAADLERWLDGEPIHARPVSRPERLWRWCKRNPMVSGLVAALSVAILIGTPRCHLPMDPGRAGSG